MTLDNIVFKIEVKGESVERFISLLRGNVDVADINLNIAYTLPVNDRLTREEKEKYVSGLRLIKSEAQDYLKQVYDAYYLGKRNYKGGRHNVEREGDYLSKDG